MDCSKLCANFKPKQSPPFPGGLKTHELAVGMLVTAGNPCNGNNAFYVILDKSGEVSVKTLCILKGYKPCERTVYLADHGCQPYNNTGKWNPSNWLREVK